jgi:anaerobic ribonucleoside-triphosphate reductase
MPDQNPEQEKTVLVIETEVYSRVVGYFRPVSGWNLGKKQEFADRVPVKAETPKKEISP